MQKIGLLSIIIWLVLILPLTAEDDSFFRLEANEGNQPQSIQMESQFRIHPEADAVTLGLTTTFFIGSLFIADGSAGLDSALTGRPKLNSIDKIYVGSTYNKTQDTRSLITAATALVAPILLAAPKDYREHWFTYGVMYGESVLLTYGFKEILKGTIAKYRPYAYYHDTPVDMLQSSKVSDSFPSGHTALAFQSAAFISTVACIEDFPKTWKYALIGSSVSLAVTTATLRVTSGSHYISDVFGGALLGTLVGVAVPLLHRVSAPMGEVSGNGEQAFIQMQIVPIAGSPALGIVYTQ